MNEQNVKSELISQAKALDQQIEDLEKQHSLLRKNRSILFFRIGEIAGFEEYGLKIGDIIEVSHKTYREIEVYRMRVESFGIHFLDYTASNIIGTIVKKNGQLGTRKASCFPGLSEYSWKKLSRKS